MRQHGHACQGCGPDRVDFPFTMAFQPIVDVAAGRIDGHEALVRGPDGQGAASVLGRLDDRNRYAFDQACRVKAIELAARLGLEGQLGINFLPNAVYEPAACIRRTLETARRTGFPLDRLTFEFTENERISDPAHLGAIVAEYHRHGFKVALDDFGTGYSGLARLVALRPDIIKLDRALVQDLDRDTMRRAIVAGLAGMAETLGIKVVAEGVERSGEVAALRAAGVRFMQGFHFARPRFEGVVLPSEIPWPEPAPAGPGPRAAAPLRSTAAAIALA